MTKTIRVFVNSAAVDLPAGADVRQAVRAVDESLEAEVLSRAALVTDGRGIEIDLDLPLSSGAVLRVVRRARRGIDADT